MKKSMRFLALLLIAALCLSLTACGSSSQPAATEAPEVHETPAPSEAPVEETEAPVASEPTEKVWAYTGSKTLPTGQACADEDEEDNGSWAIYWYCCGSNLESDDGDATDNIQQLTWVDLPENVTFVIETGGSTEWHNNQMDPTKIQRWVYNKDGFNLVDEQPQANMGESETLADFLSFATENYPADKEAVIFWDHGGGALNGVCCDENYRTLSGRMDRLYLDEIYDAFSSVWTSDVDDPPLELVGFDACLMSTIDVAYMLCDFSHYMVASEETEPGNGWTYNLIAEALAADPGMKGKDLGTVICDAYLAGCEEANSSYKTTLAVTDLNRIGTLVMAYQTFAREALIRMATDEDYPMAISRIARGIENYGGNSPEEGYFNQLDLGAFAEKNIDYVESAQTIVDELPNCVVYSVSGRARQGGHGLACFYSYDGYEGEIEYLRSDLELENTFASLYNYMTTGELDDNAQEILDEEGIEAKEMAGIPHVEEMGWEDIQPYLDSNNNSFIDLGPEAGDVLSDVYYDLYYYDEDYDVIICLGSDNTLSCDWENGVFGDQFFGNWGMIDGHVVYMDLTEEGDGYELYEVPIELNGEYRILEVMFDHSDGWIILGSVEPKNEDGMASKDLTPLEVGDEITTIWYLSTISGDDGFDPQDKTTFTVTEDTAFTFSKIGDGNFYMYYRMQDLYGSHATSAPVYFDIENGDIHVSLS